VEDASKAMSSNHFKDPLRFCGASRLATRLSKPSRDIGYIQTARETIGIDSADYLAKQRVDWILKAGNDALAASRGPYRTVRQRFTRDGFEPLSLSATWVSQNEGRNAPKLINGFVS